MCVCVFVFVCAKLVVCLFVCVCVCPREVSGVLYTLIPVHYILHMPYLLQIL